MRLAKDGSLGWLLAAALFIPLVALVALAMQSYRGYFRYAELRAGDTAVALREHALKVFETNQLAIGQITRLIEPMSMAEIRSSKAVHDVTLSMADDYPQVDSIWILDADGKVALTSMAFPAPPISAAGREFYRVLKDRDPGLFVSETFAGQTSGRRTFSLASRRTQPDGSFDGVLAAALDVAYFQEFWKSAKPDLVRSIVLMRGDGKVLVAYPEPTGQPLRPAPHPAFMARVHEQDEGAMLAPSRLDGVERFFTWRKLRNFDVYLVVSQDPGELTAAWRAGMTLPGAFALLGVAAIFLTTWFAVRRARNEQALAQRLKSAAIERERVEAQLRKTQRLEAVGQLTGGIAHDFNNLLQVIVSSVTLARRHSKVPDEWLDGIERAAFRGQSLTSHLLSFSRRQMVRPEVIEPGLRLREISEIVSRSLRPDIEQVIDIAPGVWAVEVDPTELELALLNLAINARDAMPDGGRLVIVACNRVLDGGPMTENLKGDFVAITVRDTGSGMSPEVAARAFEPFFTTKEVGKGSGLGLSQVYGFAQQAGGGVTIDSTPGAGTAITFYLPRSSKTVGPAAPVVPMRSGGALRILLVEDSPQVAAATAGMLEQLGFVVHAVDRAQDALDWLANGAHLPDLVISDVMMPGGMSGRDLARRIGERHPGISMMLVSGYASPLGAEECDIVFLAKPFTLNELSEAIIRATEAGAAMDGSSVPGLPN